MEVSVLHLFRIMKPCGIGGRSNTKRKHTVDNRTSAFSFCAGSQVLYATRSLSENAEPHTPIMILASATVVKCATTYNGKKELHVQLERHDEYFWVPCSDVYQI